MYVCLLNNEGDIYIHENIPTQQVWVIWHEKPAFLIRCMASAWR